jgi:hypothetical protein
MAPPMKPLAAAALSVAAIAAAAAQATLVFHNDQVRVYRASGASPTGVEHGPGVVVPLDDTPASMAGAATWQDDVAAAPSAGGGAVVIVRVLDRKGAAPAKDNAATAGSKPGDSPFTGMSFKTIFENDRVTLIRARMEVGAREGFHTHASDTLVVHLSGGDIEDTADGKTVVNHWKHGDVEFESRGSSHSARNAGGAVDVVLVALKP